MSGVELYRGLVRQNLNGIPTFIDCIDKWLEISRDYTDDFSNGGKILDLGSHLKHLFSSNSGEGRAGTDSQSQVAKAGVAWESLIVWYLNIIFSGSRAVCTRKIESLVPNCVLDAIAVTYGNFQTNSESDVIVIITPDDVSDDLVVDGKINQRYFERNFHDLEVGIIQCKTSFADNMQIPMLWDMVYRLAGTKDHLSVGRNGYSIHRLRKFTYSVITTPSQKGSRVPGPSGMPVKRVRNLSGGNYWGLPTQNDVALSAKEIFTRNFGSAFDLTVPASVERAAREKIGFFSD